jgi:N-acetylmuramoyl-L-alanine amidase
MKKLLGVVTAIITLCLTWGLLASTAFAASVPMLLTIDSPANGKVISGTSNVSGWALNASGLKTVVVQKTDGTTLAPASSTFSARPDVAAAFPNYTGALNSGFSISINTTSLPNGPQTINVVATGSDGQTITKSVQVTVDNAPKLCVDTPVRGSSIKNSMSVSGWSVNISGLKSISVQKVDGTSLGVQTSFTARPDIAAAFPAFPGSGQSGYNLNVDTTALPNGVQTLRVVALGTDNTKCAVDVLVTVNNLPMLLNVDGPVNGASLSGTSVISGWGLNIKGLKSVSVKMEDGSSPVPDLTTFVQRDDVTQALPGYPGNSGFSFTLDTTKLSNQTHTISVTAQGMNGEVLTKNISVKVNNAPMICVDSPGKGSNVKGLLPVTGWAINISGLKSVAIQSQVGTVLGQLNAFSPRSDIANIFPAYPGSGQSGFSFNIDTKNLPNGSQTLKLISTGTDNSQAIVNLTININNPPALLSIDTLSAGATIRGSVNIAGWSLNISGLSNATLQVDHSDPVATATGFGQRPDVTAALPGYPTNNAYLLTLDTTKYSNGRHIITVTVQGNNGETVSRDVQVQIDNSAKLCVDAPAMGSTLKGTSMVSGWALNIAGIQSVEIQKADGTALARQTANFLPRQDVAAAFPGYPGGGQSGYSLSLDSTLLPNGQQTLKVVATSITGQTTVQAIPITVSNLPMRMVVDSPGSGITVKGQIQISGWALNASGLDRFIISTDSNRILRKDDTSPIAPITTFTSRPDVIAAIPGYPDGDLHGLSYTLDTTQLPNGPQNLIITAVGKNGETLSRSIAITVNNKQMLMVVDTPANMGTVQGNVTISGWGLNISGLKNVRIQRANGSLVDPVGLTQFTSRSDLKAALPNYLDSNYANSGFSLQLDTTKLPNGPQTIKVAVTGVNLETLTWNVTLNVNNAPMIMYLDTPGNGTVIKAGGTLKIAGWALNISGLQRVEVRRADGSLIATASITARPDLDAVFPGYPDSLHAGFSIDLDTRLLSFGAQTLTIRAVGNNTEQYNWNLPVTIAKLTVVLDPGHGGIDPGACANGIEEEDINLAVALQVRNILNSYGINVVMTRTTDATVALLDRATISNNSVGDIFVSLHSNSASGAPSVNYVMAGYFDINNGDAKTDTTYDPVAVQNWQQSRQLAGAVIQALSSAVGLPLLSPTPAYALPGTESHGWVVLDQNRLPSTLVEMGFVTNTNTAAAMATATWQNTAAAGIAKGIANYFNLKV